MALPKYAQNAEKDRLVNFLCRGECQTGRLGVIIDNGNNEGGRKITSDTFVECLKCDYKASDQSNWTKV